MQLVDKNNNVVSFQDTFNIIKGVQEGNKATVIEVTKGKLLKVKTPQGFRVYSPDVMGLKWHKE